MFTFCVVQGQMANAKYGPLPGHIGLHKEFLAKIGALSCPLSDGSIQYAKDWYVIILLHTLLMTNPNYNPNYKHHLNHNPDYIG